MPADLRLVKNFPQLLKYLRDELLWPIETDDAEEITFEYTPDDFAALATEHHVQIEKILQLRPLVTGQPWGIFYVQFKKARLPVVVLRELLASLVFKKRQSANKSERPAWQCHDLLFISSYGEDADHRHLNFAHFSDQPNGHHLPALRVLDWDEDDTDRALARLDSTLHEKLRWPDDDTNLDKWREQWSAAFRRGLRHPIRKAEQLAHALAFFAQKIRARVLDQMSVESERGKLRTLHVAFRSALIQDLEPKQFADMFAQTVAYGLFTNATRRTVAGGGTAVTADGAAESVTSLSPFLRDLLDEFLSVSARRRGGLDYDKLGVNEVVDLLNAKETDLQAVLDDFGHKKRDEDPVIHFYETFLAAYDKAEKVKRGVFYTPQPVVSYIVRSVHELLQTEFGLPHGLASTETWGEMLKNRPDLSLPNLSDDPDPARARLLPATEFFVQVLDPATGTATFLVETIDVIHRHLRSAWETKGGGLGAMPEIHAKPTGKPAPKTFADFWNLYVPTSLLPRLYGYELMMAPYAIAHMKIALKLGDTGFTAWKDFGPSDRVHIYLTNALEPKMKQLPQIGFEALAHEASSVNETKWYKRFTVVIGNPPYSLLSANLEEHHRSLVEAYKFVNGARIHERGALQMEKNLNDDYVKFVRLAQLVIERASVGVSGFITNHSFLDNPTMRGVRWSLLHSASRIWLNDLHGNSTKQEQPPNGCEDVNIFQIKQGVAIALSVRLPGNGQTCEAKHHERWGTRQDKEAWLGANNVGSHKWNPIEPTSEHFLFVPQSSSLKSEFEAWPSLPSAMPKNGAGYITARDNLVIDFEKDVLIERIKLFSNSQLSDGELLKKFDVADKKGWNAQRARADLKNVDVRKRVIKTNYRPFDTRWIFFDSTLVWGRSWPTMQHVVGHPKNLTMLATRMTKDEWAVWVARTVSSHKAMSAYDTNSVFPLHLSDDSENSQQSLASEQHVNLSTHFLKSLASIWGLQTQCTPEAIFHYIYAVLNSPTYRTRYAEFLKIDFPRIPLPGSRALFDALAPLGEQLVALHLLESPLLSKPRTKFIGSAKTVIEKVSYADGTVFIDKAQTTGFAGMPEAVFEFHIGGYQVCEKWLKDRKGRTLTADDVAHYHQIVIALQETIRLMAEIDVVIEKHGGFPAAFASAETIAKEAPPTPPKSSSAPADLGLQTEDELPLG